MVQGKLKLKANKFAAAKSKLKSKKAIKKKEPNRPVPRKKQKSKTLEVGIRKCIEEELTSKAQQDGYNFKFSETKKKANKKTGLKTAVAGPSTSRA